MTIRCYLITLLAFLLPSFSSAQENEIKIERAPLEITVYRSPTCACCKKWMAHLEQNGFTVKDKISMNLASIKDQLNIPRQLTSCHTALVGDYIIEGHVPADDIKRLLLEQPKVEGLAVPDMPIGSPGMEHGSRVDPYTVFSFKKEGKLGVFNQYLAEE